MSNVREWLTSLGLGQYADVFEENDIGWETLAALDHDLLKEAGIKSIGHRVTLLKAIEEVAHNGPDWRKDEADTGTAHPPGGEAEHRQLTVMFVDLVGSTALSEAMDAEDYRNVLAAYQTAASQAIASHDGYIARYMGDGLLVYFARQLHKFRL